MIRTTMNVKSTGKGTSRAAVLERPWVNLDWPCNQLVPTVWRHLYTYSVEALSPLYQRHLLP